jgi:hypothetical protein
MELSLTGTAIPKELNERVFAKMRNDRLTDVVKQDPLIVKFGMSLLKKLGPKRANDIAQRLRQLARLTISLGTLLTVDRACSLTEYISGPGFDLIIEAINAECEAFEDDHGRRLFRNPNLALKLGHSLIKVAKLKLGSAIRTNDADAKKEAEDFISLHASDFTDTVSTPAHASIKVMPKRLQDIPRFK